MAAWAMAEFLKTRMKEIRRKTSPQPSRLEKSYHKLIIVKVICRKDGQTDRQTDII